jgi:four helix bundle protein
MVKLFFLLETPIFALRKILPHHLTTPPSHHFTISPMSTFNETMRTRTKDFAIRVVKMYSKLPQTEECKVIGKQLLRSATSVAANFRASCRARSDKEHYAKMCIVIEETDESLFWIELLEESELVPSEKLASLKQEITEILSIFAKSRKTMKEVR